MKDEAALDLEWEEHRTGIEDTIREISRLVV